MYYKSQLETDFGCRGAISIEKATVKSHDLDQLRFDVSVGDCVWYLRAQSVEDRQKWIDCLHDAQRHSKKENRKRSGKVLGAVQSDGVKWIRQTGGVP